jgi:uncharacterized membrane protein
MDFKTKLKPGTNGAVSTLGNIAMVAGSGIIATASLLVFNDWGVFWVALWLGVLGSIVDSVIGATLENSGTIGNAVTNVMACFTAGMIALVISTYII